ncbi:AbrB/MazE/SpoVT family DNA-binding domain-containing protein [Sphingobium phenoxybenzoativorans]|uniref:AbrB/MazE/SpoVT family DNA-binding domain-containing protein n=1 Tax=Sphingobium phenoxybenzoativorans TaxID=1592790 RepID=UPI000871E64D|nr:AbrB/MazE/SpoVT family DNA-binding domain-containing protein [Sphingobium phenoxybenzoativorans]
MTYSAKVIAGGKIVIPAELRRELGFQTGDMLVIEREGNGLMIKTYDQVVREVQAEFKSLIKHPFTVDEFLAEKRLEAEKE